MPQRVARRIRDRYRRSWAGATATPSRGLLTLITTAIVAMAIVVPWMIDRNAEIAREQVAVNALEDQRRDCVRAALSGADVRAAALAGVEHAEGTAALMDAIGNILVATAPDRPAVVEIRQRIDDYVAEVGHFRAVAERYEPRPMSECRDIGKDVLEPLPPTPTVPPPEPEG